MNADRLLEVYEQISEAPDAIARLRRFVLDLAVRGKLVEQDVGDEQVPDVALEIKAKRRGQIQIPIEHPFDLPRKWSWRAIGTIADQVTDGEHSTPPRIPEQEVPLVTAKNVREGFMDYSQTDWVSQETAEKAWGRCHPQIGDLLLVCVGATTGRLTVVREARDMVLVRSVALIRPNETVDSEFLERAIRSPVVQEQIWASVKAAAQPCLYINRIQSLLIPTPPLAEQHRIVAKVDELMALCDRLEEARKTREEVRDELTAASLARLTAAETTAEDFPTHAAFALEALPALTTRPDQIKTLRQTILNLAVRGKLVEQDPADEEAVKLLVRIHDSRKQSRKFAQLDASELEIELPDVPRGWAWTVVDQIAADDKRAITDGPFGSQLKTSHYIEEPGYRVIRLQNIAAGQFREEHRSYIDAERYASLANHHVKSGDLIVAGLVDPNVRCCEVPADAGPALVKADCYRFSVHPEFDRRFALYYLNSPLAQDFAAAHHHGMTLTRIGLGNFRKLPFPLPPVAEQHRIVAKVDALMALCDRLEAALTTTDTTRTRLLEALLHEALNPAAKTMDAAE